ARCQGRNGTRSLMAMGWNERRGDPSGGHVEKCGHGQIIFVVCKMAAIHRNSDMSSATTAAFSKRFIGLAAPARSGKDTVANMLLEHDNVAAYALADPLKAACQVLFGLTDEEAWGDDHKELPFDIWGRSPRQFFKRVGSVWCRSNNSALRLQSAERE